MGRRRGRGLKTHETAGEAGLRDRALAAYWELEKKWPETRVRQPPGGRVGRQEGQGWQEGNGGQSRVQAEAGTHTLGSTASTVLPYLGARLRTQPAVQAPKSSEGLAPTPT